MSTRHRPALQNFCRGVGTIDTLCRGVAFCQSIRRTVDGAKFAMIPNGIITPAGQQLYETFVGVSALLTPLARRVRTLFVPLAKGGHNLPTLCQDAGKKSRISGVIPTLQKFCRVKDITNRYHLARGGTNTVGTLANKPADTQSVCAGKTSRTSAEFFAGLGRVLTVAIPGASGTSRVCGHREDLPGQDGLSLNRPDAVPS